MPALPESNFLLSLGWAILNSFWQMALLWALYRGILSVLPRLKTEYRTGIATGFVFGGFAWFLTTFVLSLGRVPDIRLFQTAFGDADLVSQWRSTLIPYLPYAGVLYLALLVIPFRQFLINYRYLRFIRRHGLSRIQGEWKIFTGRMASYLGIRRNVQVWVSSFVKSPVTIGFLRPMILIPMAAINHLDMRQMESVLLHELAHIRRKDYLFNFLLTIIQSILYFNPFVKWMVQDIEEERETSCDQLVIRFGYNAHSYATALLSLEKGWTLQGKESLSMAMAATGGNKGLLKRIEQIVGIQAPQKWWSPGRLAGLCLAILLVLFSQAMIIQSETRSGSEGMTLHEWVAKHFTFPESKEYKAATNKTASPVAYTQKPAMEAKTSPVGNATFQEVFPEPKLEPAPVYNDPNYQFVSFRENVPVQLTREEEAEIAATMEATRKVARELQWEAMKNQMADAYTQREKLELKKALTEQVNQQNWAEMEKKLRTQYEQVDWDQVNAKLDMALAGFQMDSLIHEVTLTQEKIKSLEGLLVNHQLSGIPDTDLNLENLRKEKEKWSKELEKLRNIRNRKIIRL